MRGATQCARRVKTLFSSLRSKLGKVSLPAATDPVTQCILGILSRDVPESKAREALDRIRTLVVDYNELRVVPPFELAEMVGDYPDVRLKSEDISRALNKIFALHHSVSLDHLTGMSRKDAVAYLEALDGLEDYTRARIRLLALRQHAVPLDEAMWAYARQREIIDHRCPLGQAQSFLERQIAEGEALEFYTLLNRQAWSEMATAVRRGEVARIISVPPDRTSRNMLQTIGVLADVEEPLLVEEELEPDFHEEPEAEESRPTRTPATSTAAPKRKSDHPAPAPAKISKKPSASTKPKRAVAAARTERRSSAKPRRAATKSKR
jgi:hypothetical protein